jgi:tetratricopeptide (TPR) repeat protein
LADGRHHQALQAFQRALAEAPHHAPYYIGQAAACSALGRDEEAERLLRTALLTEGGADLDRVRVRFALARLHYRQGRIEKAIQLAEEALLIARDPSTHIPGRLGSTDYAHYLFHAEAVHRSLLPQLSVITVTDEVAGWMLELGGWYEEIRDAASATHIYNEVLEEVPDCDIARERLTKIDGATQD